MIDRDQEGNWGELGRTAGKAEGPRDDFEDPGGSSEGLHPGFTPGQAEGDRETEEINLGEREE